MKLLEVEEGHVSQCLIAGNTTAFTRYNALMHRLTDVHTDSLMPSSPNA